MSLFIDCAILDKAVIFKLLFEAKTGEYKTCKVPSLIIVDCITFLIIISNLMNSQVPGVTFYSILHLYRITSFAEYGPFLSRNCIYSFFQTRLGSLHSWRYECVLSSWAGGLLDVNFHTTFGLILKPSGSASGVCIFFTHLVSSLPTVFYL